MKVPWKVSEWTIKKVTDGDLWSNGTCSSEIDKLTCTLLFVKVTKLLLLLIKTGIPMKFWWWIMPLKEHLWVNIMLNCWLEEFYRQKWRGKNIWKFNSSHEHTNNVLLVNDNARIHKDNESAASNSSIILPIVLVWPYQLIFITFY